MKMSYNHFKVVQRERFMEKEGQSLRDYGNRKKRYKRRRRILIVSLLLIFVFFGAAYLISLYNRDYESFEVLNTSNASGENSIGYLSYGNAVIKYSLNGVTAINKDGSLLWDASYEMSDPIADICGKYVVIADRKGKDVHIFNEKGAVGRFQTQYDILKVEVAHQGVVVALMEEGDYNYLHIYNVDGKMLADKKTSVKEEGYPLDITLSDDGEKLVTSYLSYAGGVLENKVGFFNFGEVGQNWFDRVVGGRPFDEGIIIPRVVFVNNDAVCLFKNNGFVIYEMEEIPSLTHEEELEGEIQSVLYNKKHVGLVLKSLDTDSKKLLLYDLAGNKVLEKKLNFSYDRIFMTESEIIMYDNISSMVMKLNGKVKFNYTFDSNITAFYPINNLDKYFLIEEAKVSEILLKE